MGLIFAPAFFDCGCFLQTFFLALKPSRSSEFSTEFGFLSIMFFLQEFGPDAILEHLPLSNPERPFSLLLLAVFSLGGHSVHTGLSHLGLS